MISSNSYINCQVVCFFSLLASFSPFFVCDQVELNQMLWFMHVCAVVASSLFIVRFTHWVYRWRNPKCINGGILPPGSMGFPFIGETLEFFAHSKSLAIPSFIQNRTAKYGSVFKTSLVGRPVIVSADSKLNQFIFQQEGKLFEFWYMDSFMKIFREAGISSSNIFTHKYFKSLVMEFLGHENLKNNLLPEIEKMATQGLCSWSNKTSVEVVAASSVMIFNLTSKKLISYDSTKSSVSKEGLLDMYHDLMENLVSFPLNIPGFGIYKCLQARKKINRVLKSLIEERRRASTALNLQKKSNNGDFLDRVIEEINEKDESKKMINEEMGIVLMFVLLFASYETTSLTLSLAMKLITENPSVLNKLTEEHEAILRSREDSDSPITWNEYKSMTFTFQVIDETLRLANIAPVMIRKAMADIQVNGYTIPKGWAVMVSPVATHLDPAKFEDPLAFNPWRWDEGKRSDLSCNELMAFGGGMRLCAGAELAKMVIAVFLHSIVTKYRWTAIKGGDIVRAPGLKFTNGFHIKLSRKDA